MINSIPTREKQILAVSQLLTGSAIGMQQQQLLSLLGRGADRAQLLATLNTMVCHGIAVRIRGRGPWRYALASKYTGPSISAENDNVHLAAVQRADDARSRAASAGAVAPMPPRAKTVQAESVEHWMARTGQRPQIISNNFDNVLDQFPGRRPSMPRFIS